MGAPRTLTLAVAASLLVASAGYALQFPPPLEHLSFSPADGQDAPRNIRPSIWFFRVAQVGKLENALLSACAEALMQQGGVERTNSDEAEKRFRTYLGECRTDWLEAHPLTTRVIESRTRHEPEFAAVAKGFEAHRELRFTAALEANAEYRIEVSQGGEVLRESSFRTTEENDTTPPPLPAPAHAWLVGVPPGGGCCGEGGSVLIDFADPMPARSLGAPWPALPGAEPGTELAVWLAATGPIDFDREPDARFPLEYRVVASNPTDLYWQPLSEPRLLDISAETVLKVGLRAVDDCGNFSAPIEVPVEPLAGPDEARPQAPVE